MGRRWIFSWANCPIGTPQGAKSTFTCQTLFVLVIVLLLVLVITEPI